MAQIEVGNVEFVDRPNGVKKLQLSFVKIKFIVDCPCDKISVKVYTHETSTGGSITTPSGTVSKGDITDPQGESWTWQPGRDGWRTDSVDANPEWHGFECKAVANGNEVTIMDSPGLGIPQGSQAQGYSYAYEFTWKVDLLCDGQVIDHEYYRLSFKGTSGPNGLVPEMVGGAQGQDALDEVNDKMRDAGTSTYPVDAEGKPW
ncbi:hypothetical protein [Winogradskyella sp. 3972H.M.0a.05]|uniref:hypothetical protein n=1 Tax=Winogradskyella sp. 3972H.M.0a.05 TaxID=2950277 RepID=UPI003399C493